MKHVAHNNKVNGSIPFQYISPTQRLYILLGSSRKNRDKNTKVLKLVGK